MHRPNMTAVMPIKSTTANVKINLASLYFAIHRQKNNDGIEKHKLDATVLSNPSTNSRLYTAKLMIPKQLKSEITFFIEYLKSMCIKKTDIVVAKTIKSNIFAIFTRIQLFVLYCQTPLYIVIQALQHTSILTQVC